MTKVLPGTMNPNVSEYEPSTERVISPYVATRPLRQYVGRHNRQAVLLAFFSLVAAALMWGALYLFIYWFALFGVTLAKSFDPLTLGEVTDPALIGPNFPWWFAGGAVAYLGVAAFLRGRFRLEKVREARLYLLWVLLELFMSVPNVTFAIWGNLRALTSLRKNEAVEAWRLLHRMKQEDGRLSLASLRLVIDEEKTLCRVVFALQLTGLVGMRENSQGWFLYLQGQDVQTLLGKGGT